MSKKVLIVDDDPVVRILVGECLTAKGYEVSCADGASECFQSLATSQPDVIVLDFYMPDMSGMEVLMKMRENPSLAKLPILMLSADSGSEQILKDNNIKPDAFLQKPVGLDQIVKAVVDISGAGSK